MTQHDTNYVIELQIPNQLKHFSYRFRRIVDQIPIPTSHVESTENQNTRCAWAGVEEQVRVSLIFAIIVSFMLFTVFTLANIYDSQFMWIHDFEE